MRSTKGEHMSESHRNDFNEPEDEEIPLSVRFQARRAILNAQERAKMSTGSLGRMSGCCKEIRHGDDINDFIEDTTENIKIVCNRKNTFNYEEKNEGDVE